MKRFRFRLARVHEYRTRILDEKRRELARCSALLRSAQAHLQELESERWRELPNKQTFISVGELLLNAEYSQRLAAEIVNQQQEIIKRQQETTRALADYLQASQEEKALAKLREKRYASYLDEQLKEEINSIDELTTQRHGLARAQQRKALSERKALSDTLSDSAEKVGSVQQKEPL